MGQQDAGVVMATSHGGAVRVLLSGRVDAGVCERLGALLDDVGSGTVVRVDLSRADVLPVAALRSLTAASRRLSGSGGRLVLEHPSAGVARTLRTSGLHRVLAVDGWPSAAVPAAAAEDAAGA